MLFSCVPVAVPFSVPIYVCVPKIKPTLWSTGNIQIQFFAHRLICQGVLPATTWSFLQIGCQNEYPVDPKVVKSGVSYSPFHALEHVSFALV